MNETHINHPKLIYRKPNLVVINMPPPPRRKYYLPQRGTRSAPFPAEDGFLVHVRLHHTSDLCRREIEMSELIKGGEN